MNGVTVNIDNPIYRSLLDFSIPFNVSALDDLIKILYSPAFAVGSAGAQYELHRQRVQTFLTEIQEHPDMWNRVDAILEHSQQQETKFFGLQILENTVKYRWKVLPPEQREGIKTYVVDTIIKISSGEASAKFQSLFLKKLNMVLIAILKHEWPHSWPTFISDIVNASKSNEVLCENNMVILKLLSEEIFDFSTGNLTVAKTKDLKASLNSEFILIFELCQMVLTQALKPSLLIATLDCLHRYLSWIPLGYIFETNLIRTLVSKFFPNTEDQQTPWIDHYVEFQNSALLCLTEVAQLQLATNDNYFQFLIAISIAQIFKMLPPTRLVNLSDISCWDDLDLERQTFVKYLALFFSGFMKSHLSIVEVETSIKIDDNLTVQMRDVREGVLQYLVMLSRVPEMEIFKICLEYWNILSSELYHSEMRSSLPQQSFGLTALNNLSSGQFGGNNSLLFGSINNNAQKSTGSTQRLQLYSSYLSQARAAIISRMAKPEEVLIVEDENGELIRENMKDTETISLYQTQRETLIFLTHLDSQDTLKIMLTELQYQVDGTKWSPQALDTLCWAIGSISGSMDEDEEKTFLVNVIRDLLGLCEHKRGKDNKARIASNIMFVVGQYPRFLKAHWRFLQTVVNKLFEFMHETHPGVQDMACDTFLKIAQKCRRKFVIHQPRTTTNPRENGPFIDTLLQDMPTIIRDLESHQVHTFYQSVAFMVQSQYDVPTRERLIEKMMELPNQTWQEIMLQASQQGVAVLRDPSIAKSVHFVVRTNAKVAAAIRYPYVCQMSHIYLDMLNVYKAYSEIISNDIATATTPHITKTPHVRQYMAVKKEILRLLDTFVESNEDLPLLRSYFVPALLEPVLGDYARSVPDARDPDVLSLFTTIIKKLTSGISDDVSNILDAVFPQTLEMITRNFEDFPDHRINFYKFLRAINESVFAKLISVPPSLFQLVVDSIVWAFKHTERNVAEEGLCILQDMLNNFNQPQWVVLSQGFYQKFYLSLMSDIFYVLTDTAHKPGFKLHAAILMQMFHLVERGRISVPLYDENFAIANPGTSNSGFIKEYLSSLLRSSFPNLSVSDIMRLLQGLFNINLEISEFKQVLRDFLVQLKEFSGEPDGLFDEEHQAEIKQKMHAEKLRLASVPGLLPVMEREDDMGE